VSLDWHQFASPSGILEGFEAAVTFVSLLVLLYCDMACCAAIPSIDPLRYRTALTTGIAENLGLAGHRHGPQAHHCLPYEMTPV